MIEELKKKYVATFEDKTKRLSHALEVSDLQVLSTLIHQLAGSSGSYGFITLSEQCLKVEQILLESMKITAHCSEQLEKIIKMMEQIRLENNK
ncbi:MAG: Hpt domain-containing protein [Xanthomonadales bacterium]|nr:Hpt domain-containing protein [Xanthomonadales bacterium]